MRAVKYVKKDAQIQNYKAVTHDQVISVVRQALVDNGIVSYPYQIGEGAVTPVIRAGGEMTNIIRYSARYEVSFVNMDDPSDRIVMAIEAHANDTGDKAPGKAVTYAVKMALLKILMLETGENDESRTEPDDIDAELAQINAASTLEALKHAYVQAANRHRGKKDVLAELNRAKDGRKLQLSSSGK
jgi:hypothetical protein